MKSFLSALVMLSTIVSHAEEFKLAEKMTMQEIGNEVGIYSVEYILSAKAVTGTVSVKGNPTPQPVPATGYQCRVRAITYILATPETFDRNNTGPFEPPRSLFLEARLVAEDGSSDKNVLFSQAAGHFHLGKKSILSLFTDFDFSDSVNLGGGNVTSSVMKFDAAQNALISKVTGTVGKDATETRTHTLTVKFDQDKKFMESITAARDTGTRQDTFTCTGPFEIQSEKRSFKKPTRG